MANYLQLKQHSKDLLVYIENVATFLGRHPLAKLTIMSEVPHYFHTAKQKKFIKDWITKNIYRQLSFLRIFANFCFNFCSFAYFSHKTAIL